MKAPSPTKIKQFQKIVYDYYRKHKRDLPWRKKITPYAVLVSEIMLQQTQVSRGIVKFHEFMERFPNFKSLAVAPTSEVLRVWQGLGYNRRAIALKKCAEKVVNEYGEKLPKDPEVLNTFPGIGPATAASIAVYAFNLPRPFIETNIRAVYIHHFFPASNTPSPTRGGIQGGVTRSKARSQTPTSVLPLVGGGNPVSDTDLLPIVEATMDTKHPREWYYALMDYSSWLKREHKNPGRRSAHYVRQSKFEGSNRQLRGKILRTFLDKKIITLPTLAKLLGAEKEKVAQNLEQLIREGFIEKSGSSYTLKK